jgi:hypothetical protein
MPLIRSIILILFVVWCGGLYFFVRNRKTRDFFYFYAILGTLLFFVRLVLCLYSKTFYAETPLEEILQGTASTPYLYRVLVPLLAGLLKAVFSLPDYSSAGMIWNYLFIMAFFPLFHGYLKKWFDDEPALLVVVLLGFWLPNSFGFNVFEDFLELIIFTAGFWLIREKQDQYLYPLIFLAALNKETSLFIVVAYLVSVFRYQDMTGSILKSLKLFTFWLLPTVLLRLIRGIKPYGCEIFTWPLNLRWLLGGFWDSSGNLLVFQIFIVFFSLVPFFLLILFFTWKKLDKFLKRNLITVLLYCSSVLIFAYIIEIRVFYPILPILIPAAFYSLGSKESNTI